MGPHKKASTTIITNTTSMTITINIAITIIISISIIITINHYYQDVHYWKRDGRGGVGKKKKGGCQTRRGGGGLLVWGRTRRGGGFLFGAKQEGPPPPLPSSSPPLRAGGGGGFSCLGQTRTPPTPSLSARSPQFAFLLISVFPQDILHSASCERLLATSASILDEKTSVGLARIHTNRVQAVEPMKNKLRYAYRSTAEPMAQSTLYERKTNMKNDACQICLCDHCCYEQPATC